MRAREAHAAVVSLVALALIAGCAGRRIEHGVFHSEKGYRATLPAGAWSVVEDTRADLELRHASGRAGMTVNATCDPDVARRPAPVLQRALLAGLRDQSILEHGPAAVGGRPARRILVEGRAGADGAVVRIEALTLVEGDCVVDLLYAAPPDAFAVWAPEFARFAGSLARDSGSGSE